MRKMFRDKKLHPVCRGPTCPERPALKFKAGSALLMATLLRYVHGYSSYGGLLQQLAAVADCTWLTSELAALTGFRSLRQNWLQCLTVVAECSGWLQWLVAVVGCSGWLQSWLQCQAWLTAVAGYSGFMQWLLQWLNAVTGCSGWLHWGQLQWLDAVADWQAKTLYNITLYYIILWRAESKQLFVLYLQG